jgi:hypothetical protein
VYATVKNGGANVFKDPTKYIPWGNTVVSEKLINVSLMRTC